MPGLPTLRFLAWTFTAILRPDCQEKLLTLYLICVLPYGHYGHSEKGGIVARTETEPLGNTATGRKPFCSQTRRVRIHGFTAGHRRSIQEEANRLAAAHRCSPRERQHDVLTHDVVEEVPFTPAPTLGGAEVDACGVRTVFEVDATWVGEGGFRRGGDLGLFRARPLSPFWN